MASGYKESQIRIESLLESLSENSAFNNRDLENMMTNTYKLMDEFQNSANDMASEFEEILESFSSGRMSSANLEAILSAERQKGLFTMELAEEMGKFIDGICSGIYEMVKNISAGNQPQAMENIESIFDKLDQAMETVVGMSKIASSSPAEVKRAIDVVTIGKSEHMRHYQKNRFQSIVAEIQKRMKSMKVQSKIIDELETDDENNGAVHAREEKDEIKEKKDSDRKKWLSSDNSGFKRTSVVRTEEMISSSKIESAYLSRPAQYNILVAGRKNNNYASDSPAAIPASRAIVLSDDSVQQLQQNALMSMAAERSKSESSHLAVPLSFTTTSTQTIKDIPPRQRHHKIFSIQVLPRKRSTVRTLSEDGSPGAADITGIQSVVKGSYSQDRLAVLRGEQSPLLSGSASQTVGSLLKVSDQNTVRESGLHDRDSKLAVTKKKKRGSVIGSLVGKGGGGGGATSTSASLSKPNSAAAASRSSGALL